MNWTKTPPTKPGAYWWRPSANDESCVVEVTPDYHWRAGLATPLTKNTGGEWCGPLVPVEEVEKAWKEGSNYGQCDCRACSEYDAAKWLNSRAKKIVEGKLV